jgi:class 3 adenylate cyclase
MSRQLAAYAQELEALRSLHRSYERLLPHGLSEGGAWPPAPATRVCTALFTDLRGFSGLAERFADEPARLLELLNEHFVAVVRAISRCGGIIEKFVGDGVLATFGAHADMPDHCDRALAAALATVGANEMVNRRRSEAWGLRLDVGVGAAAGKVVVGLIGSDHRSEIGVLGDAVNIAARLVARAGAGEALLAASVYEHVAGSVRAELLGLAPIRGRSGEVEVYRLQLLPRGTESSAAVRPSPPG